jgi:hypothetical protein
LIEDRTSCQSSCAEDGKFKTSQLPACFNSIQNNFSEWRLPSVTQKLYRWQQWDILENEPLGFPFIDDLKWFKYM